MSTGIIEEGFSISHEYNGNRVSRTLKTTTIKEWVGQSYENVIVSDVSEGYGSVSVAGRSFSNAKILSQSFERKGSYGENFRVTKIEEDITSDTVECTGLCGISAKNLVSFSDKTSISETVDATTTTRSMSVQVRDDNDLVTVPPSSSGGSATLSLAVGCMQSRLSGGGSSSCDGKLSITRSETIDEAACSASMTRTEVKKKKDCEEGEVATSSSKSITYDEYGLVTINLNGDIRGLKEEYNCDRNGNKTSITKTKFDFAEEYFNSNSDLEAKIKAEYTEHEQEDCEKDVCLALVLNSKSISKCRDEGTISWKISATEQENLTNEDGVSEKIKESKNENGCITDITRSFELSVKLSDPTVGVQEPIFLSGECPAPSEDENENKIEKLMEAFEGLDFDAPENYFGPLTLTASISPTRGTISGSMTFSNNPEYDTSQNEEETKVIRKNVTKKEVCAQEFNSRKKVIPCGRGLTLGSIGAPAYTRICIDLDAFPCATIDEIIGELDIDLPSDAVVLEDTVSISVNEGAKTASACLKYHTDQDLKGLCAS